MFRSGLGTSDLGCGSACLPMTLPKRGRAPCALSPRREGGYKRISFFFFSFWGFNNVHPIPRPRSCVHDILVPAFSGPCTCMIPIIQMIRSFNYHPFRPILSRFPSSPNSQPSTLRSVKAVTDLFLVISRYPVGHTAIGLSFERVPGERGLVSLLCGRSRLSRNPVRLVVRV